MSKPDYRLIAVRDKQDPGQPSKELKFVVGVLMDARSKKPKEMEAADFKIVERANFDTIMAEYAPTLQLADGQSLTFSSFSSLRPESFLRALPKTKALLELRQAVVETLVRDLSAQDSRAMAALLKQAARPALPEGGVQ